MPSMTVCPGSLAGLLPPAPPPPPPPSSTTPSSAQDTFAFWGAGGAPFFNRRARNIKLARLFARYDRSWDPFWGTCLTSFGFGGTFEADQLMCCQDVSGDLPSPGQPCGDVFYNGTFQNGQHAVTFQVGALCLLGTSRAYGAGGGEKVPPSPGPAGAHAVGTSSPGGAAIN